MLYRNTRLFFLLILPLFLVETQAQRHTEELTEGWRFMRGSFPEASKEDFNDESWPYVRIPLTVIMICRMCVTYKMGRPLSIARQAAQVDFLMMVILGIAVQFMSVVVIVPSYILMEP